MLGDVKFHTHRGIEAQQAERKKGRYPEEKLGEVTLRLAQTLGYAFAPSISPAPVPTPSPSIKGDVARSALAPLQPRGSGRPWFFVHAAGGGVACYQQLARLLGLDQPVYGLQAASLDGDRGGSLTVEQMASNYLTELRKVQPHGPYRLGGWSVGGVIAFEMALQLERSGEQVETLPLVDSVVLDCTQPQPPLRSVDLVLEFAQAYGLVLQPRRVRRLPKARRLAFILRQAKMAGLAPAALSLHDFGQLYRRHMRVFRANVEAVRRYAPHGRASHVLLLDAADQALPASPGPSLEWADLAENVERRLLPGTHYSMLREPCVAELARHLREAACAEQAPPGGGASC
jgi:thioesterase domain-containing protein